MNNPDNGINTYGQKEIVYHGLKFVRDDKTGYYLNTTNRLRLHRFVWEQNNTIIPKEHDVHHLNGDKNDNTVQNLRLLQRFEHHQIHGKTLTEKQLAYLKSRKEKCILRATEWHKSEEGIKWHREHVKKMWHKWHTRTKECECIICHNKFFATKKSILCSNKCKAKYRRMRGLDLEKRICEICGKEFFVSKYVQSKTCSPICRGKLKSKHNMEKNVQRTISYNQDIA